LIKVDTGPNQQIIGGSEEAGPVAKIVDQSAKHWSGASHE
jgi:hypothetical protein